MISSLMNSITSYETLVSSGAIDNYVKILHLGHRIYKSTLQY